MRALIMLLTIASITIGCASKKYVSSEIEASEVRTQTQIEELKQKVEETQTEIGDLAKELDLKLDTLEDHTSQLGDKTEENAKMIERFGHLSFQKTLSDAEAFFNSDEAELSESAVTELDKFASLIKSQNKMLHLEIQGHTDSRGSDAWNEKLGQERAETVRNHLYKNHDIPLHLMNVISMGSESPVADNSTRDGRAQNRRVVLVVRMRM